MTITLFEDPAVSDLYPITLGRPAFAVSCGGYRLIDQIRALGDEIHAVVRPHLQQIAAADYPELAGRVAVMGPAWPETILADGGPHILVNARLVPSIDVRRELARLLHAGVEGQVHWGKSIAAAIVVPGRSRPRVEPESGRDEASDSVGYLDRLQLSELEAELPLIDYPHELLRYHIDTMNDNLHARLAEGEYREIADGVLAAPGAKLDQYVVVDASRGPIVLEADASVGPFCALKGPAYLGADSQILPHTILSGHVAAAHTTRLGGEVHSSIVEPYSNKRHSGFLGHSYLGSWINIGAGTSNSNLKNTYGLIKAQYGDTNFPTEMQFLGMFMGDYTKTAINTSIFTGKLIGACSMLYGFVTKNVPSFVNYAQIFGQLTAVPVDIMIATQARMFSRRDVTQRPCDIQLLHDMARLTQHERDPSRIPLKPPSL